MRVNSKVKLMIEEAVKDIVDRVGLPYTPKVFYSISNLNRFGGSKGHSHKSREENHKISEIYRIKDILGRSCTQCRAFYLNMRELTGFSRGDYPIIPVIAHEILHLRFPIMDEDMVDHYIHHILSDLSIRFPAVYLADLDRVCNLKHELDKTNDSMLMRGVDI